MGQKYKSSRSFKHPEGYKILWVGLSAMSGVCPTCLAFGVLSGFWGYSGVRRRFQHLCSFVCVCLLSTFSLSCLSALKAFQLSFSVLTFPCLKRQTPHCVHHWHRALHTKAGSTFWPHHPSSFLRSPVPDPREESALALEPDGCVANPRPFIY